MAKRLWFAAKRYGYGWYPITWEGWLVVLEFVALLLMPTGIVLMPNTSVSDMHYATLFVPYALALTVLLIWISAQKGEKARWRWGK